MFTLGNRFRRSPRRRNESGSAAMEFGLTAPFLVLLAIGAGELGMGAYEAMQVQNAAQAGAVYVSKYGMSISGISNAVTSSTGTSGITATPAPVQFCGCPSGSGVTTIDCTGTCGDGSGPGQYVRINARMTHRSLVLNSGISVPVTVSGEAVVRLS